MARQGKTTGGQRRRPNEGGHSTYCLSDQKDRSGMGGGLGDKRGGEFRQQRRH